MDETGRLRELEGQVILVSGAAQGIGRAIALELAARGAYLALCDLNPAALNDTAGLIATRVLATEADVARSTDVSEWVMGAWQYFGQIDALVNNAGIFPRRAFMEMTEQEWDSVINTNLKSAFLCSRQAAPYMGTAGGGTIINISSNAAFEGTPAGAHYAASKAGLLGLSRALALELAPYNITVNVVAPGLTDTAQPRGGQTEEQLAESALRIPLGRMARPADIAGVVAWLCGPQAGYITGQTLHVNGGSYRT